MEGHPEEALFIFLVDVDDLLRHVEEDLRLLRVGREDVNDSLLLRNHDAVGTVAHVGEQDRTQRRRHSVVIRFPTGPFEILERDDRLHGQR